MRRINNEDEYLFYLRQITGLNANNNRDILLDIYGKPKEYPCLVNFVRLMEDGRIAYDFCFVYKKDILRCLKMLEEEPTS